MQAHLIHKLHLIFLKIINHHSPVPNETLTPAFTNLFMGQVPELNFRFDEGQEDTFASITTVNTLSK